MPLEPKAVSGAGTVAADGQSLIVAWNHPSVLLNSVVLEALDIAVGSRSGRRGAQTGCQHERYSIQLQLGFHGLVSHRLYCGEIFIDQIWEKTLYLRETVSGRRIQVDSPHGKN